MLKELEEQNPDQEKTLLEEITEEEYEDYFDKNENFDENYIFEKENIETIKNEIFTDINEDDTLNDKTNENLTENYVESSKIELITESPLVIEKKNDKKIEFKTEKTYRKENFKKKKNNNKIKKRKQASIQTKKDKKIESLEKKEEIKCDEEKKESPVEKSTNIKNDLLNIEKMGRADKSNEKSSPKIPSKISINSINSDSKKSEKDESEKIIKSNNSIKSETLDCNNNLIEQFHNEVNLSKKSLKRKSSVENKPPNLFLGHEENVDENFDVPEQKEPIKISKSKEDDEDSEKFEFDDMSDLMEDTEEVVSSTISKNNIGIIGAVPEEKIIKPEPISFPTQIKKEFIPFPSNLNEKKENKNYNPFQNYKPFSFKEYKAAHNSNVGGLFATQRETKPFHNFWNKHLGIDEDQESVVSSSSKAEDIYSESENSSVEFKGKIDSRQEFNNMRESPPIPTPINYSVLNSNLIQRSNVSPNSIPNVNYNNQTASTPNLSSTQSKHPNVNSSNFFFNFEEPQAYQVLQDNKKNEEIPQDPTEIIKNMLGVRNRKPPPGFSDSKK